METQPRKSVEERAVRLVAGRKVRMKPIPRNTITCTSVISGARPAQSA